MQYEFWYNVSSTRPDYRTETYEANVKFDCHDRRSQVGVQVSPVIESRRQLNGVNLAVAL
jgi:hypothetical protein